MFLAKIALFVHKSVSVGNTAFLGFCAFFLGHSKSAEKGACPHRTPMTRPVKVNNFSKNLNVLMDERSEAAWPPPFLMSRSSYSTQP